MVKRSGGTVLPYCQNRPTVECLTTRGCQAQPGRNSGDRPSGECSHHPRLGGSQPAGPVHRSEDCRVNNLEVFGQQNNFAPESELGPLVQLIEGSGAEIPV